MALLTPNTTYSINGVTVNEKIIPDGTRWKNADKAKAAGFSANSLYKKQVKLTNGTGVPRFVTIHNTDDLDNVNDDAEQYQSMTGRLKSQRLCKGSKAVMVSIQKSLLEVLKANSHIV